MIVVQAEGQIHLRELGGVWRSRARNADSWPSRSLMQRPLAIGQSRALAKSIAWRKCIGTGWSDATRRLVRQGHHWTPTHRASRLRADAGPADLLSLCVEIGIAKVVAILIGRHEDRLIIQSHQKEIKSGGQSCALMTANLSSSSRLHRKSRSRL